MPLLSAVVAAATATAPAAATTPTIPSTTATSAASLVTVSGHVTRLSAVITRSTTAASATAAITPTVPATSSSSRSASPAAIPSTAIKPISAAASITPSATIPSAAAATATSSPASASTAEAIPPASLNERPVGTRHVDGLRPPVVTVLDLEFHSFSLSETPVAVRFDRRLMNEQILVSVVRGYETEALLDVEPLHHTRRSTTLRHRRQTQRQRNHRNPRNQNPDRPKRKSNLTLISISTIPSETLIFIFPWTDPKCLPLLISSLLNLMEFTILTSSSRLSSPSLPIHTKFHRRIRSFRSPPLICCRSKQLDGPDEESSKKNHFRLLEFTVTLTVVSYSLYQFPAEAKVSEKKRSAKKTETLSPEELKSWSRGLPIVGDRVPYTELLSLKAQGKLKHIIKLPSVNLKQNPDSVLVVLEDSRVWRTVLPSIERDNKFWENWDKLGLDSVCVNAYSPPVKKPEIPSPYLGFLSKIPLFLLSLLKAKPRSKKAIELENARKELQTRRKAEVSRMRAEREAMEKAIRVQKKIEEKKRNREIKKINYEQSLKRAKHNYQHMANVWASMARDKNVAGALGFFFFFIFYRTVVFSYRRQRKDYEDRLKIEKAEAEERKKLRELEKELGATEEEEEEGESEKNPYMKMAMKFMRSGAMVRRARNKRVPQYMERGVDVKFSDVAGLGKIRLELEEIVKFFTYGEMYKRRGVRIPGGILLCGPPGVGKTLLAKAVAGEAGVNFFSISASQFVEIYVGVGASRVRALYQEARENAPSVVFIDELDAVGRERGLIKGSGGQERDATLNQLLVCLDGFEGRGNVITIAATNRPDILDPALVRPGRFDRKIYIPKPGVIGRVEILKVHARKKPMADDVDYLAVAGMTEGMVGAELANIVEVAAITMMREGRSEITTDDLLQAAQMEERGMLDKKDRSVEMWKQLALNEAAMAVVAVNFPDLKNIEFVTIAPRAGRELGYVRVKMDHMKFKEGFLSRQSLLDYITVQLAPRAADEIWYGEEQLSTMWAETADNARSAARTFVLGGLSEKHYGLADFWVADRLNEIDLEALRILNMCYERAKEILHRNGRLMDVVVDALVQKKSLSKQDFFRMVEENGCLEPLPPNIIDIRNEKRVHFQEMMMMTKEALHESTA